MSAAEPILRVSGLGKRFGGFIALADIELEVARGERLGLIGPNGSGKSTLVNCLAGTLRNEAGSVRFEGKVLDGAPAHLRTRAGLARNISVASPVRHPDPGGESAHSDPLRGANPRRRLRSQHRRALPGLFWTPWGLLADKAARLPKDLTQIEMRQLELARAMASEPRLLIADEAMAGLSHGRSGRHSGAAGPFK